MKNILLAACFLICTGTVCTSAAFAQSVAGATAMSGDAQMLQMPGHPSHASEKSMDSAKSLFTGSGSSFAKGEIPLWEVAPTTVVVPLGDSARALKKEHAEAKKAQVTWVN